MDTPTTPRSVLLCWDIDGTLVRAGADATGGSFPAALSAVLGRPATATMKMDGMTDRQIAATLLELEAADPALIERVLDALDACALAPVSAPRPIALAGVAEVMKKAAGLGHVNALLTGNTPTRARVKVTNAGYSADTFAWAASAFGDQTPRRSDLAQHIVHVAERRGLVPLIIGDTPHDARAAASVGIAFCGVASGAFTAGELLEHESVVVIEDFVHGAADFFVALDALAVK